MKKGLILIPLVLAGLLSIVAMRDDSGSHISIVTRPAPRGSSCQRHGQNEVFVENTHDTKRIQVIYEVTRGDSTARKMAYPAPNNKEFIACDGSDANFTVISTQYH